LGSFGQNAGWVRLAKMSVWVRSAKMPLARHRCLDTAVLDACAKINIFSNL